MRGRAARSTHSALLRASGVASVAALSSTHVRTRMTELMLMLGAVRRPVCRQEFACTRAHATPMMNATLRHVRCHCPPFSNFANHEKHGEAMPAQTRHAQASVRQSNVSHKNTKCTGCAGTCTQQSSDDSAYRRMSSMSAPYAMRALQLHSDIARCDSRRTTCRCCHSNLSGCRCTRGSCSASISIPACSSASSPARRARGCDWRTQHVQAHARAGNPHCPHRGRRDARGSEST